MRYPPPSDAVRPPYLRTTVYHEGLFIRQRGEQRFISVHVLIQVGHSRAQTTRPPASANPTISRCKEAFMYSNELRTTASYSRHRSGESAVSESRKPYPASVSPR